MSKFQVSHEAQRLTHGDIAVCFEQHESQRASGLYVSENELCQDIQTDSSIVLVKNAI